MVNHMFFEREEAKTLLGKYQFQSACGKLVREGSAQIKMVMEDLLAGKSFQTEIDEELF